MKRLLPLLAAALAACSSDKIGPDPDAIDGLEKATVQSALNTALKDDTLYPTLAFLVFPYIDRASHVATGSSETRMVGIQLDINAMKADTPVVAKISALLAWRGYNATRRTVDSVFFLVGAGIVPPPVGDSLRTSFAPDTAGTGTGFVIHQNADSSLVVWLTRTGAFHLTSALFGSGTSRTAGGLTLVARRGTVAGDHHLTAKLVPDSSTQVSAAASFAGGIQALKMEISGTVP